MMAAYFEGNEPTLEELEENSSKGNYCKNEIFPVYAGSALKNKGVQLVLGCRR